MTIELNPVGVKCNLACTYCYETEMREAGNYGPKDYDLEKMQAGLLAEIGRARGGSWTLHGGEPLLMPVEDIEAMWAWGKAHGHQLGIQTNGSLITDRHIELALRYDVPVGISIDGPGAMNDLRARGTIEKTRAATAATEAAIEKLTAAGVRTSVIIVLHRLNIDRDRRAEFKAWIRHLDTIGVTGVRFHPMEIDAKAGAHAPPVEDYLEFYRDLRDFMEGLPRLRIDIVQDIRRLLVAQDERTTCTWNACDPYTTAAVHGVDGQGTRTNCGRTQKDGVMAPKADQAGFERYIALYYTPQSAGGCQGCRFFAMCKGQCPGEGIAGDWRNRSMYCALYYGLFEDEEARLRQSGTVPVSLAPDREEIERAMVEVWSRGGRLSVSGARKVAAGQVSSMPSAGAHGDQPHGDSHGDHTDYGRAN